MQLHGGPRRPHRLSVVDAANHEAELSKHRRCNKEPEDSYAQHCREADLFTAPLRDSLSYYNGDGKAGLGSLVSYGGPAKWHRLRAEAQATPEPYVFEYAVSP